VPQATDMELIRLYTASTGLKVQNNEPNLNPYGPPSATFQLHLEAVSGNVVGGSGAGYVLTITAIDEMLAAPNTAMSPGLLRQQFDSANGWHAGGPSGDFVAEQTFNISIDSSARGHLFHYVAALIGDDRGMVSFAVSNRFILV
jgi:hypothetical protein